MRHSTPRARAQCGTHRADSDVIKTYVELGLSGIVAQMAYDPGRDSAFEARRGSPVRAVDHMARHPPRAPCAAIYEFILLFAPALDRAAVDAALSGAEKPDGRPA
jgi:hypothetical protein